MKKVAILEENGRLDAVVESQQQEILELQDMMRDLSTKLHSALEDKAIFEEKYKLSLQELQSLAKDSSQQTGTSNHSSGLSMEEQEQVIDQLTKQVTLAKEEIEELKNTISIFSQENENLVVELSDKDLMIHKLQTNSLDFEDQNRQKDTSQIRLQTQMLEESERSNDALRNELSALKLEYTTASIQWERAKAMLDKEIMSLKEPSVSGSSHMKDEITSLQQEVSRLEAALTQSEHILKESEEIAWKHKAEAAEILYAYESDQAKWQEERKSIESRWNTEFQNLRTRLQQESNIPANGELILTDSSSAVDQTQQLQSQEMADWKQFIGSLTERLIASAAEFSSSSSIHQYSFSAAVRTLPLPTTCEAASLASLSSFRDALCEVMLFAEKFPHLTQKVQFLQEENERAMESAAILYKRLYPMLTEVSTTPNVIDKTENGHSLTSAMHRALSVVDGLESNYDVNTISWKFSVLRMLIFLCELYNRLLLKALHPKRNRGKVNYYKRRRNCRHCKRSSSVIRILQMSNCKKHDRNFLRKFVFFIHSFHSVPYFCIIFLLVLCSAEDEIRKLHQVIAQLRSLRRTKDGEEQSAQQELQHLRTLQQQLTKECDSLKIRVRELEQYEARYAEVQEQFDEMQVVKNQLEEALNETKRYLAGKEKQCYDQLTSLDVAQAEQRLMQQEINLRMQEINNLNDALAHIDAEHQGQLQALRRQIQDVNNAKEEYAKSYASQQAEGWKKSLMEVQKHAQQLTRQLEDQELFHRQHLLQLNQEKQQMQKSLENAIQRLQNTSQDVIDRTLMANLFVQYFQRKKSKEVLSLIARVLNLTDEQLIIVGLRGAPVDIVNTLLTSVIGPTAPVQVEGDNLAELWVNYLINQASADEREKAKRFTGEVGVGTSGIPPTALQGDSPISQGDSETRRSAGRADPDNHGSQTSSHSGHGPTTFPAKISSNFHSLPASPVKGSAENQPALPEGNKNMQELPPDERPLGGFLGAAASVLTFGGYWRK